MEKKLIVQCHLAEAFIIGELVTYNIMLTNADEISLEDIILYEILEFPLVFNEGSIEVDGIKRIKDSPFSGIEIGTMKPGQSKNIQFEAMVMSEQSEEIETHIKVEFVYNEDNKRQMGEVSINLGKSKIYRVALEMEKRVVSPNNIGEDEALYKIILKNNGQLKLNSVIFQDNIPEKLELLEDTINVGGKIISVLQLGQGIFIGSLEVEQIIEISYRIKDDEVYENMNGTAIAKYSYELPNGQIGGLRKQSLTAKVLTNIQRLMTNQLNIGTTIEMEEVQLQRVMISEIEAEVDIISYEIIETSQGKNVEGQKMTGNKMIIQGILTFHIDYIEDTQTGSTKRKVYQRLFTTSMTLKKNYEYKRNPEILGEIKHIYYDVGGRGEIIVNAIIFVRLMM